MKTLLLAAALAAVGTPALAQSWNYGNYGNGQFGNCGSNYQNYGRAGYPNGYLGSGYGGGLNPGVGYGRSYPARDPWAYRSVAPHLQQRSVYDPVHGDFHPTANFGYGSSRSGFDSGWYGHGGY